jgi:hypothetical protein
MGTTGEQVEQSAEATLSEETIHTVLSNERRRLALEQLQTEGEMEISTLAEHVAAEESGEDPPPRDVRRSVYVSLQQRHVPRLVDARIVRYDEQSKRVALDGSFDDVAVYMELVPPGEIAWADVYVGLAVLGSLLTAVVGYDLVPGVPGDAAVYAVAVFLVIGAAALYQRASLRL